jgi:LmbE family N-acetylglucosaminyl deacetylase
MPYHRSWLLLILFLLGTVVTLNPPPSAQPAEVLIIAPHPDDAVLCCAGVIQQAKAQGKTVRVVNVTDGDGYKAAAAALFHKSETAMMPADMRKFGRIRRREELQALNLLGVTKHEVMFLGYPDGWLSEVYETTGTSPTKSPYTEKSQTDEGGLFTRTAIQETMRSRFVAYAPKELYIPSGLDDALDHRVAYQIITDAINTNGYTGRIYSYFTHMAYDRNPYDTTRIVPLSTSEQNQKLRAILQYRSQLTPDGEFLPSFAAPDERFY